MSHKSSNPSHSSKGEQKFRPYFSSSELLLIIQTLKSAPAPAIGLIKYLETFSIKIERGIISPQITLQESLESRLGLSQTIPSSQSLENLVTLWESYPESRAKFSPQELEKIQAHRYASGKMTPEEEIIYENSLIST